MRVGWAAALALWAALGGAAGAAAPPPIVRAVELRVEPGALEVGRLQSAIGVEVGQPLASEAVERSLRALAATGLAAEVEAWQRAVEGGVEVIFAVRPGVQVAEVRLAGKLPLAERRLRAALVQHPGDPLVEDRVLRGLYRLEELLRGEGWRGARVYLQVETDARRRRAIVTYRLDPGGRTRVGAVSFVGERGGWTDAEFARLIKLSPGDPYRTAAVAEAGERLHRGLVARGYRLAAVEEPREQFDSAAGTVDLAYPLVVGPLVEVEVVGANQRELERRDLLTFLAPTGYDEALVLQSLAQVRRYYQAKGHYRVRVDKSESRTAEKLALRLSVDPGPLFELTEVRFTGNTTLSATALAERMASSPRRALSPGTGRLVDEVLSEDLANLRSTYALAGFGRAKVGPPQIEERNGELTLTVPVSEGPRQTVASVEIVGVEALDRGDFSRRLAVQPGGPYHRLLLDQSVDLLRSAYEQQGYAQAIVSPTVLWDESGEAARVILGVIEGGRTTVNRVLVRGNARTRARLIERTVDLPPGTPASAPRLLEAERELYRLGLFSRVDVRLAPGLEGSAAREVIVDVEEGRTRRVGAGLGYDSEAGARALLTLGEANLFGRALNVQADLLTSAKDERYRLAVTQPYLGAYRLNLLFTGYWERQERDLYDLERRGSQLGVQRDLGRLRLRLIYDYRIVELPRVDDVLAIPAGSRSGKVSSLTPFALYDRRDDPLDPKRGWSLLGQMQWAYPVLSADADFLKVFAQATAAVPLGRVGTLAGSLRWGGIEPFGTAATRDAIAGKVPIDERFFAGGRTSHRAFGQDELGIEGETLIDGSAVGGSGLLLVNLDFRFPIFGDLGGTVFVDGGNVWRERGGVDPNELRWGAGLGIRYRSPIGPLRLEVGWKLEREPGESGYVWFFSLGNPF